MAKFRNAAFARGWRVDTEHQACSPSVLGQIASSAASHSHYVWRVPGKLFVAVSVGVRCTVGAI